MPSFYLDDKEIEFNPGEDILSAVLKHNEFIPHYCFHPALSRVATCRMCMVDIADAGNGKPMPKLQTSCTTSAVQGMKVVTKNEKVRLAREGILEFLLINHPLDCSICDQAGECSLQDYSFEYGTGVSQVDHEKRIYGLRDIGTFLQLERNRCIHCTRCVRFSNEITNTHEMGMFGRNHQLTVDTFIDYPLTDLFQGNLSDICPVGAITLKDFRFRKRVWKLKKTPSICTGCSTGCNIWVNHHEGTVYRYTPRENMEINKWWMCDLGRISFHEFTDMERRRLQTVINGQNASWNKVYAYFSEHAEALKNDAGEVIFLVSAHATCEEIWSIKAFAQNLSATAKILALVAPEEKPATGVYTEDLIMNDKTPNRKGLELLGVEFIENPDGYLKKIENLKLLVIIGNEFDRLTSLNQYIELSACSIIISELKSNFDLSATVGLPSVSHLEKNGHFVNKQGIVQKINRSVPNSYNTKDICQVMGKLHQIFYPNETALPEKPEEIMELLADVNPGFSVSIQEEAPDQKIPIPSHSY